jgi:hypothetical protein
MSVCVLVQPLAAATVVVVATADAVTPELALDGSPSDGSPPDEVLAMEHVPDDGSHPAAVDRSADDAVPLDRPVVEPAPVRPSDADPRPTADP